MSTLLEFLFMLPIRFLLLFVAWDWRAAFAPDPIEYIRKREGE